MPRGLILLMLAMVQVGIPGAELAVLLFSMILPSLRLELLTQALAALRDLERLEAKLHELSSCCASCAQKKLVEEIEFEIVACRSQIRRLRRELQGLDAELEREVVLEQLSIDTEALALFYQQRRELNGFSAEELQQEYVRYLRVQIQDAQKIFSRFARAYRASSEPTEDSMPEPISVTRPPSCVVCSFALSGALN